MNEQHPSPREEERSDFASMKPSELALNWPIANRDKLSWAHNSFEDEDDDDDEDNDGLFSVPKRHGLLDGWNRFSRHATERMGKFFAHTSSDRTFLPGLTPHAAEATTIGASGGPGIIDDIHLDYEDMYKIPEFPMNNFAETTQGAMYDNSEQPTLPSLTASEAPEMSAQILPNSSTGDQLPPPEAPPIHAPLPLEIQRMPDDQLVQSMPVEQTVQSIETFTQPAEPQQRPSEQWWPAAAAAPVIAERSILRTEQPKPDTRAQNEIARMQAEVARMSESQQKLERIVSREQQIARIEPLPRDSADRQPQYVPFTPNVVPDTDRLAEQHVKPEVVLESVAVAAEQNTAVERVYERRQEVRDEPAAAPVIADSVSGAPSVASILAAQQAQQAGFEHSITTVTPLAQPQQPIVSTHYVPQPQQPTQSYSQYEQQDMYRQAARTGFWVALVVIVGAVVFYFVR